MARFFRSPNRKQLYLLPVDMLEWVPDDDIVHLRSWAMIRRIM
jgi:hypothetical protein